MKIQLCILFLEIFGIICFTFVYFRRFLWLIETITLLILEYQWAQTGRMLHIIFRSCDYRTTTKLTTKPQRS